MERFNQSFAYLPMVIIGVTVGGLIVLYVASVVGQQELQQAQSTSPVLNLLSKL